MLADRDLLTAEGELRNDDVPLPDTVQAIIAARLDTLPPERKALLHDAAVMGKVFWSGAVAAMGGVDESSVRAGLQELGRKELVRAVRESSVRDQAEYAFWHALVRDVAYSQIPRRQRVGKHVAAAEWIERMVGDRVTDHAELLAYHYEQALDLERATGSDADVQTLVEPAARAFELAGDRTMSLDVSKAQEYYMRAADLYQGGDVRRGDLLVKAVRGRVALPEEAVRRANEAIAIFRAAGDEVREGVALIALGGILWLRGDAARSKEIEIEALEKLERHPPGEELLAAYARRAGTLSISGRTREALEVIDRALRLAEQRESHSTAAQMYQYRGIARSDLGDLGGLDDVRRGLELAREIGDLTTQSHGYANLASNLLPVSPTQALDVWNEGIEFTGKRGITVSRFWQLAESTWALFDLGRWDEVSARATEVVAWVDEGGPAYPAAIAAPQHALVLLHRGQLAEAASLLDRFVPVAREAGDPQVVVPAFAAGARLAAAHDDLPAALQLVRDLEARTRTGASLYRPNYLPDVVAIAVAAGAPDVAAAFLDAEYRSTGRIAHSVVAARAVFAEQTGELEDALSLYEDAAARWNDHGFVLGHAEALHGAGRCLVALGREHQAATPLREARELFARLGAQPAVERVDDVIARATSRTA
jgi:tetratricopeptide (TPR) repeat protein